jgi:hypothetical protein
MDQKISVLVKRQVPEYVREQYPLFLSFVEAYYEFLENKQGTQKNDLLNQIEVVKNISDVDSSIDEFETYFFNTFASSIPAGTDINKAFLIKNILPLYQSKGSESSFRLLFRLLYDTEIEIKYPRDNILRASAGNWKIENTVKVSINDISSFYVGDGTKKRFRIVNKLSGDELQVYLNEVLQTTGFKVLKDYQIIEFDSAIPNGDDLEIFYESVDKDIFNSRKITGETSGSSVIVERVFSTIVNNENVYELYVDKKTLIGEFTIGEKITTDVFVDDESVDIRLRTISKLKEIQITNIGSNYNIGDPVIINSPGAERVPKAFVSRIYNSSFDNINILESGAGFELGAKVRSDGVGVPFVDIDVNSIFLNSSNSANVFRVFTDVISDINPANTSINSISYGLSGPVSGNLNTVISHCFSNTSFVNIGEIIGININSVLMNYTSIPILDAEPANLILPKVGNTVSNTVLQIKSYGSLGKTRIINGGQNYQVGDQLTFTNPPAYFGFGAEAEVREVDANGSIKLIKFVPSKISGTVNVFTSNTQVVGSNTFFLRELRSGDKIWVNGEDRTVNTISSNTSLNVYSSFSSNSNQKVIRLYGKYPVGGANYDQNALPTINVISSNGINANIQAMAVFGDGEILQPILGNNIPGGIRTITIIDYGKSLLSVPELDLSSYGDGQAVAEAVLIPSFDELNGKWLDSEGLISDLSRKLQGLDYYIDFSYVIRSTLEFVKYKDVLKSLIHPGGSIVYSELDKLNTVDVPKINVTSEITQVSI